MNNFLPLALPLTTASLAGCVDTHSTRPTETSAMVGGDLSGAPARACRAAIAKQVGISAADVDVFNVLGSEAGILVEATVATATDPGVVIRIGPAMSAASSLPGAQARSDRFRASLSTHPA